MQAQTLLATHRKSVTPQKETTRRALVTTVGAITAGIRVRALLGARAINGCGLYLEPAQ